MNSKHRSSFFVALAVVTAIGLVSVVPSQAEAQRRSRRGVVVVAGYPYYPWHYWGPYRYPPYAYGFLPPDTTASLRLQVTPRQAQVFVDGYYAGIVDEFDGVFQRLRLEPGGHTIALYLEGYRTVEQDLYLRPGASQHLRLSLEPLAPGEQVVPPTPSRTDNEEAPPQPPTRMGRGYDDRERPVQRAPARLGTLLLRVQPADAEIVVDGQRWEGPASGNSISIPLEEGRHRIEVRRPGVATYVEDVLIRRDRTLTLNVNLSE